MVVSTLSLDGLDHDPSDGDAQLGLGLDVLLNVGEAPMKCRNNIHTYMNDFFLIEK